MVHLPAKKYSMINSKKIWRFHNSQLMLLFSSAQAIYLFSSNHGLGPWLKSMSTSFQAADIHLHLLPLPLNKIQLSPR